MTDPELPPPSPSRHGRLRVVDLHDPAGVLARVEAHDDRLQARFIPIADLTHGVAAGYEARLRLEGADDAAAAPSDWSQRVHPDVAGRLEARLLRPALEGRTALPANAFLLISVSAGGLRSAELPAVLAAAGRLERVVLIVADESHGAQVHEVRRTLEAVRDAGGHVAVDETGAGYASLRQVLSVRPD